MALLLTGRPGIGKTTAIHAAAAKLVDVHLVGFYTEELRSGRERLGFRLTTFDGDEAIVAHVDLPPPRVSRYGVDVAAIDRFAARLAPDNDHGVVYLIDEIGRMECLSTTFVAAVRRILERRRPLVATVAQRGSGFIEEVKRRPDVDTWTVTENTRELLPDQIVAWVRRRVQQS
jgi:nucleoside-triphosphatase